MRARRGARRARPIVIGVGWIDAIVFALPLALVATPLSFSAWYLCRALPLSRTPADPCWSRPSLARHRLGGDLGGDRLRVVGRAPARRVGAARSADAGARGAPGGVGRARLHRVGDGALCPAGVRGLRRGGPSCAGIGDRPSRGRAAGAARAGRSALSVQQPEFDRGADDRRPQCARGTCASGWPTFCATASRWAHRRGFRSGARSRWPSSTLLSNRCASGRRLVHSHVRGAESADVPVPPLILQPLVENAVRHGIATCLDGGRIEIATRRVGDRARDRREESARRGWRPAGNGLGTGHRPPAAGRVVRRPAPRCESSHRRLGIACRSRSRSRKGAMSARGCREESESASAGAARAGGGAPRESHPSRWPSLASACRDRR